MADGRVVPLSTKVKKATAERMDEMRGELSRSAWLAKLAEEATGTGAPQVVVVASDDDFRHNEVTVQTDGPPVVDLMAALRESVDAAKKRARDVLESDSKAGEGEEPQVKGISKAVLQSVPDPDECAHPKAEWKNRGYGTFCGLCNKRMR